jgi:hypothetical protein
MASSRSSVKDFQKLQTRPNRHGTPTSTSPTTTGIFLCFVQYRAVPQELHVSISQTKIFFAKKKKSSKTKRHYTREIHFSLTTTTIDHKVACVYVKIYIFFERPKRKMGNSVTPLAAAKEPNKDELSNYSEGPYWCEKPDAEAIVRYAKTGPASKEQAPAMTVPDLLTLAAKRRSSSGAMFQEPPSMTALIDGKKAPPPVPRDLWKSWTWQQYLNDVRKCARAMMSVGFVQHDACTIFGFVSVSVVVTEMIPFKAIH